jgi:type VI secretion system protein ImpL
MRWFPTFWLALALCLAAWGLLWWALLGAGRAARRRALDARIRLWERTHPPPSAATLGALRRAASSGRRALCHASDRHPPPHRRPWVLFAGDPAADLPGLLEAAHPAGPLASPQAGESDLFWRWWLMDSLAAIEVCPPPLAPALPQDSLWLRALRELVRVRPRLPLDGLAVCVSTAALQADASVARPTFELLCRRVQDTVQGLRVHLPVYVIVTGLQRLPGYATVHAALPPEALAHTLGLRAGARAPGADSVPVLDLLFDPLMLRLQALRLGLLPQMREASARADVHAFVEAMQALGPGLKRLYEQMAQLEISPGLLAWQVLCFTASGPNGAFVSELFCRWIPEDQGLARPQP